MIYTVTFNPAIDYVVRLDRELQVGDVNRARGEDCVLGGKGINVSGVLAQLGCESVALGFVAGETGAWLERGLAAQGLKTDFVHLDHGMTRINVKIKAGQETELNGAGPDIPEAAMQALEQKLDAHDEGQHVRYTVHQVLVQAVAKAVACAARGLPGLGPGLGVVAGSFTVGNFLDQLLRLVDAIVHAGVEGLFVGVLIGDIAVGRLQSSVTAPRHIVASSASISAFVARPRLNAVALPQAVPRRRAAS